MIRRLPQLIVRLHQRYCTTWQVRLVWTLLIVNCIVQVMVVAFAQ